MADTHSSNMPSSQASKGSPPPTPERLMQFAFGYAPPLIIESAVRLGVFDALDSGPKTAKELSASSNASLRGITAIANALVGIGLLCKPAPGVYGLTPESEMYLVSTKPAFYGGLFRHMTSQLMPAWMHIEEIVKTGTPGSQVNTQEYGSEFFEKFVEALFPLSYRFASLLADELKIANVSKPYSVLDIGSGSGVWGIALAQKSPHVHVTAVDWPRVLETTKRVSARFGVSDRFRYNPGDLLLADFGSGHQAATVGHILHSEGEARSRELLKRIHVSLAPGGTIAIAEFVCNEERTGPAASLIFAVNMLVNTEHGDTYTMAEISSWLGEAGFVGARAFDVGGHSPLILANKPG